LLEAYLLLVYFKNAHFVVKTLSFHSKPDSKSCEAGLHFDMTSTAFQGEYLQTSFEYVRTIMSTTLFTDETMVIGHGLMLIIH
jgi:hypothetical protein